MSFKKTIDVIILVKVYCGTGESPLTDHPHSYHKGDGWQ